MERGSPFHSEKFFNEHHSPPYTGGHFSEDMTQDSGPSEEDNKDHIQLLHVDSCSLTFNNFDGAHDMNKNDSNFHENNQPVQGKSDANNSEPVRSDSDSVRCSDFTISNSVNSMKSIRMNIRRKRFCSNSSAVSNNDSVTDEKRRRPKKRRKRKTQQEMYFSKISNNQSLSGFMKDVNTLTSTEQYVTHSGEVGFGLMKEQRVAMEMAAAAADSANLEVPRWRTKVYTSCYTMEGTENLDDEVYNKRHSRLENDERRRKRYY